MINPDFLIIAQNAAELYQYPNYRLAIDGFGVEDTWYDGNSTQDKEHTNTVLSYLVKARQDGKMILSIDYPTRQRQICDFYEKCKSYGFYCAVFNRDLDENSMKACKEAQ